MFSSTLTVKDTLPSLSCASYSALLKFATPIQTANMQLVINRGKRKEKKRKKKKKHTRTHNIIKTENKAKQTKVDSRDLL